MSTQSTAQQLHDLERNERREQHARYVTLARENSQLAPGQGLGEAKVLELYKLRQSLGITSDFQADSDAIRIADNLEQAKKDAQAEWEAQPPTQPLYEAIAKSQADDMAAQQAAAAEQHRLGYEAAKIKQFKERADRARELHARHVGEHAALLDYDRAELLRSARSSQPAGVRKGAVNTGDYSGVGLHRVLTGGDA